MVKSVFLPIGLALFISFAALPVVALEFSVIAGGVFQTDSSKNSLTAPVSGAETAGAKGSVTRSGLGWGAFVALDITYAEFTAAFLEDQTRADNDNSFLFDEYGNNGDYRTLRLSLSALAKYPFGKDKFTFFPLLGLEYQFNLERATPNKTLINYEGGDNLPNYNTLWLRFGAGADYALNERFYLRGEVTYGFRTSIRSETSEIDHWKDLGGDGRNISSGLLIKLGCGFVLNSPAKSLPFILNRG